MDESNVNNNNNAKDKSSEVFVPADPEVVRRRLFQEGEENDQSSQEYQCAAESVQICSSSWGNSKHDAASTDKKETEKDKEVS